MIVKIYKFDDNLEGYLQAAKYLFKKKRIHYCSKYRETDGEGVEFRRVEYLRVSRFGNIYLRDQSKGIQHSKWVNVKDYELYLSPLSVLDINTLSGGRFVDWSSFTFGGDFACLRDEKILKQMLLANDCALVDGDLDA